jgi:hypothetical protein
MGIQDSGNHSANSKNNLPTTCNLPMTIAKSVTPDMDSGDPFFQLTTFHLYIITAVFNKSQTENMGRRLVWVTR